MSSPRLPVPPMRWDGWGDPDRTTELSTAQLAMVNDLLKVSAADVTRSPPDEVRLRPSALADADHDALAAIVGDAHISTRRRRPPAPRRRQVDAGPVAPQGRGEQDAPDAVVMPGTEDEIAAVLAVCAERGIAVVPVRRRDERRRRPRPDPRPVHRLRLARPAPLRRARVARRDEPGGRARRRADRPGRRGAAGRARLRTRATTRRASATRRSAGSRPPARRGRTRPATAASTTWCAGCASSRRAASSSSAAPRPRTAAGPDLRQLFLGSEGVFGVITAVRVRVHPLPRDEARTRRGRSPTSPPAPRRCAPSSNWAPARPSCGSRTRSRRR